ncbi:S26 family signal peptidase [Tundrisphaera lichenicola]|uniref:S26 family signal peptidase n=1 Tax=Tundrisphaera lichenicola TaxID=2029860 RepID=UPI003EB8EC54
MSRTSTKEAKIFLKSVVPPSTQKPKESTRDFIEQIVVAIILAVLIRGFDAEAFVIPTGSMAPTLMGRHKEVVCPSCGYTYAINASDDTEEFVTSQKDAGKNLRETGICVNCRFRTEVDGAPSFKGDRILVMKFPYELPFLPGSAGPKRWDVVVFHYPEKPETNYIKRLVGEPGEELRIDKGDIQTRPAGSTDPFQIQRKSLIHQQAMQMLVNDDRYRPSTLADKPEWRRWNPVGPWKEAERGKYDVVATGPEWSELRYRHLIPDPEQWAALEEHQPLPRAPRASLITDFYSYNTNVSTAFYDRWLQVFDGWLQLNWVGDLTVSCRVDLASVDPGGKLRLELVEAGVSNRCEVDLITGLATIYHGETKLGEAGTGLHGIGAHDVKFANVDDRLTLWIDGETPFSTGLIYDDGPEAPRGPTAKDLDPVGMAIQGAKASVSDLVLKRDIYYTQDPRDPDYRIPGVYGSLGDSDRNPFARIVKMFDFLSDPEQFAALGDLPTGKSYSIRPDHYMMMGDNSPRSSDGRAWETRDYAWRDVDRSSWEVPRSMLIGKAFFVYWPHGKPFGPDIRITRDFRIPFRPYFERMKWIR